MSLVSDGIDDDDDGDDNQQSMGAITVVTPKTNNEAKDALGTALRYLSNAYAKIEDIKTSNPLDVLQFKRLRDTSRDALDRNRVFTENIYRNLPSNNATMVDANKKKVAVALKNIYSDIRFVERTNTEMKKGVIDDLKAKIAAQIPGGGSGFIGTTLKYLGGALVIGGVGYYLLRRTEKKVIEHVTGDGE